MAASSAGGWAAHDARGAPPASEPSPPASQRSPPDSAPLPPPEAAGFADMDDALLVVVVQHLPLEDLCRAQRVCRRLRDVIVEAQGLWRALYAATWPSEAGGSGGGGGGTQQQQQQQPQQQPQPGAQPRGPMNTASGSGRGCPPDTAAPAALHLPAPSNKRKRDAAPDAAAAAASQPTAVLSAGATAPGAPAATAVAAAAEAGIDWRQRFRARYIEEARRERAKRQARRLRAEDALVRLRQEVHHTEQALAAERAALPALRQQLEAVRQARQAAATARLARLYWQPVAVQQAHGGGMAVEQEPQDAEAREHDLQQRLAVAELEVRKLTAGLEARQRRLAEAQRRLQALQP